MKCWNPFLWCAMNIFFQVKMLMDRLLLLFIFLILCSHEAFCIGSLLETLGISTSDCNFGELQCAIQCEARRFKTGICHADLCHCLRHTFASFTRPSQCRQNCGMICKMKHGAEAGTCDKRGTCLCHDNEDSYTVPTGQCIVPKTFCQKQCRTKYFEESSCVDELCLCATGLKGGNRRFTVLDFSSDYCPIPRTYCIYRCNMAKFDIGSCYDNHCICSASQYGSQEDHFSLDLKVDDSNCDNCQRHCTTTPMGTGRCIANQCVCMNLDNFEVAPIENTPYQVCELPTEYCMRVCAIHEFSDNAVCKENLICLCGKGMNNKKLDFLKGPCKADQDACANLCIHMSEGVWLGFCSETHCICLDKLMKSDVGWLLPNFACLKNPPMSFTSVCYII